MARHCLIGFLVMVLSLLLLREFRLPDGALDVGIPPPPLWPLQRKPWPHSLHQRYPDLVLSDPAGHPVHLADLAGRPLLIEMVAMTSGGSQAMLGGNDPGIAGYGGIQPQADIPSLEELLRSRGIAVDDPRFVRVILLVCGMDGQSAPTTEEARDFVRHFALGRGNQRVLVVDEHLARSALRGCIPGFHLVDCDFFLRWDATPGQGPWNWLYVLGVLEAQMGEFSVRESMAR